MERKKALILLNARAGMQKGTQCLIDVVKRTAKEGYEPIVYPIMHGRINSEDILAEYDGKIELVICIGGDGTLNHVVSGVVSMTEQPRIGYIPSGSTNDFARTLGIPLNIQKALDTCFRGEAFSYDVGMLGNGKMFSYTAAFGAFTKISYDTDQKLKNAFGYGAYVLSAAGTLQENLSFKRHMRIEADGFAEEGDYLFGTLSNSVSIGGMEILRNRDVKLDDGKMELLLIHAPKNAMDISSILGALMRGDADDPNITLYQTSKITVTADEKLEWSIDGEFGGSLQKTKITVLPRAVTIMRGKEIKK